MAGAVRRLMLRRSPVPGEYTGPVWLLKRDDPHVWFGTGDGVVFTGTVFSGANFREELFLKPLHVKSQKRVETSAGRYRRTLELGLRDHGAPARTARDGPGRPVTMKAFYHPGGSYLVAGWDSGRKIWVVE